METMSKGGEGPKTDDFLCISVLVAAKITLPPLSNCEDISI